MNAAVYWTASRWVEPCRRSSSSRCSWVISVEGLWPVLRGRSWADFPFGEGVMNGSPRGARARRVVRARCRVLTITARRARRVVTPGAAPCSVQRLDDEPAVLTRAPGPDDLRAGKTGRRQAGFSLRRQPVCSEGAGHVPVVCTPRPWSTRAPTSPRPDGHPRTNQRSPGEKTRSDPG